MKAPDSAVGLARVLADEFRALGHLDMGEPAAKLSDVQARILAGRGKNGREGIKTAALCLSGGGIRSATFNLGVLQTLAERGYLDKFHYLSTVSGGGYIGSWLSTWAHRHPKGLQGVIEDMRPIAAAGAGDGGEENPSHEPEAISNLRSYSNYLAPKFGLLTADTWTLIATYLRNLVLHWLIVLPLILLVLLVPELYSSLLVRPGTSHYLIATIIGLLLLGAWFYLRIRDKSAVVSEQREKIGMRLCVAPLALYAISLGAAAFFVESFNPVTVLGSFGAVLLFTSVTYIGLDRPSGGDLKRTQRSFLLLCLTPLVLAALALTIALYWVPATAEAATEEVAWYLKYRYFLLFGTGLYLAAWCMHLLLPRAADAQAPRAKKGLEALAVIGAGALSTSLVWCWALFVKGVGMSTALYVCFAAPLLLIVFALAETIFVGLGSRVTKDEDREWWARSGAWILIFTVCWAALASIQMYDEDFFDRVKTAIGAAGGLTALLVSLWAGFSGKTPATKEEDKRSGWLMNLALFLAVPLFTVILLLALSRGLDFALDAAGLERNASDQRNLLHVLAAMVALALFAAAVSLFININRFSLHAMYRNRLIRAYFGASRRECSGANERDCRRANPFTGFDEEDNLKMHAVLPKAHNGERRLFPVINIALNLVRGRKLAWQERKAESFTVTPLYSGSAAVGYRDSESYGDGITLGTAMAISGAAASPNMGYHSSTPLSFLMTLFNVRLGWWLGSPRNQKTYRWDGPRFALFPLIAELLGYTDNEHPWVYLSDGGHFENLGVYEMIVRRCRLLVVIDASCDPECAFDDFGNAVRKVRADLGVPINVVGTVNIFPRSRKETGKYCALAEIDYGRVHPGAEKGHLLYIKPSFYGDESIDVYNYAQSNKLFPHESTGDQFFSESQFESYRALGSHIASKITNDARSLDDFIVNAMKQLETV